MRGVGPTAAKNNRCLLGLEQTHKEPKATARCWAQNDKQTLMFARFGATKRQQPCVCTCLANNDCKPAVFAKLWANSGKPPHVFARFWAKAANANFVCLQDLRQHMTTNLMRLRGLGQTTSSNLSLCFARCWKGPNSSGVCQVLGKQRSRT